MDEAWTEVRIVNKARQDWLRGAYQDRIREVALWLADKSGSEVPGDEYDYLHELTGADHAFLREETARQVGMILRERRETELRERHRILIAQTTVGFKMDSASRGYDLDQGVFDAFLSGVIAKNGISEDERDLFCDIVLAEVWPKLKAAHAALRRSVFDDLKASHPDVISEDAVFAMDIGWSKLLDRAAARIGSYPPVWSARLISGKEKLGCLVLSVDCDYTAPGCRSEVERLREEIRLTSLATCELCGEAGRLRLAGYAKTVCDKHLGVLGELRDDDGVQADPYNWVDDYPSAAAENLKDMNPVGPRPIVHVIYEDSDFGSFLDDMGDGLEMMQEAQADGIFDDLDSGDQDDDDKTRH